MTDAELREAGIRHLLVLQGEPLRHAVTQLASADAEAHPPQHNEHGEPLVSFDPDGTGYTAREFGDMLDARVARMERGEGVLTMEEFRSNMKAFWAARK